MADPAELKRNETYYLRNEVVLIKKKGFVLSLAKNTSVLFIKKETEAKGTDVVRNYVFTSPTTGLQLVLSEENVNANISDFLERAEQK